MTSTVAEPITTQRPDTQLEDGDHERFSHYADKDKITDAMINGTPVVALCGKVWVPTRDPKQFPVCPTCRELFDMGPEGRMAYWQERQDAGF